MANFDNGVSGYIKGRFLAVVNFPIDHRGHAEVTCYQCPYYRRNYQKCGLNDEMVAFGEKFIGQKCPLEFDGEVEEI